MRILAISGSLRRASLSTALLRAAAILAPKGVEVTIYDGLAHLPHFNPDIEAVPLPSVKHFRTQLQISSGLLISSPEYAHGVPGVLKNALDWLVKSGELVNKPVALLNASPETTYVQASLLETLKVMSALVVREACLTLPQLDKNLGEVGLISHLEIAHQLQTALSVFAKVAEQYQKEPER